MTTFLIVLYALVGVSIASLIWHTHTTEERATVSATQWAFTFTYALLLWPAIVATVIGAIIARAALAGGEKEEVE